MSPRPWARRRRRRKHASPPKGDDTPDAAAGTVAAADKPVASTLDPTAQAIPVAAIFTPPQAAPTQTPSASLTGPAPTPISPPAAEPTSDPAADPSGLPTSAPTMNSNALPVADPIGDPLADLRAVPAAVGKADLPAGPTSVPISGPSASPLAATAGVQSTDGKTDPTSDPAAVQSVATGAIAAAMAPTPLSTTDDLPAGAVSSQSATPSAVAPLQTIGTPAETNPGVPGAAAAKSLPSAAAELLQAATTPGPIVGSAYISRPDGQMPSSRPSPAGASDTIVRIASDFATPAIATVAAAQSASLSQSSGATRVSIKTHGRRRHDGCSSAKRQPTGTRSRDLGGDHRPALKSPGTASHPSRRGRGRSGRHSALSAAG